MKETAKEILKIINEASYDAYFVGGTSRDFLLGLEFNDIDIATNAPTNIIDELFDVISYEGKAFGCLKVEYKGIIAEITTFRKEQYNKKGGFPTVAFLEDYNEDYVRRDFTVNAIYIDKDENIFDPSNGIADLNKKLIRFIGKTSTRILEDPSRIFRALRIAKKIGFEIDKNDEMTIRENISLAETLSQGKIKAEIKKMIKDLGVDKTEKILLDYRLDEYMK